MPVERPGEHPYDISAEERQHDQEWLGDNLHMLWPGAQEAYTAQGRGAVVIDTTQTFIHEQGMGHPTYYFTEDQVKAVGDEDAIRMVREYDPSWEFVATLIKPEGAYSIYRVGAIDKPPPRTPGPGERRGAPPPLRLKKKRR